LRSAPSRKLSEILIIGAVGVALGYAIAAPASAQGLLQRLFDPPVNTPAPAANQPRVVTIPVVAEKNEDAARLLVVGDFMARGVADALVDAFADEPSLIVVDRTNGSSGIVRDDFYDWNELLPEIIEETEPTYIVMMIGTNDRQTLRADGAFELRSADWDRVYGERVATLAEAMAPFGPNALWISQPPMRGRSMSGDMAYFNTVYEAAVDQYGLTFVDIWDAFADQDGRFTTTGPDVEGQVRLLRADDGFSFTRAGRTKVAFFVETEIDLVAGGGALFVQGPGAPRVEVLPGGVPRVVGPVLLLGAPPPDAPTQLLTEAPGLDEGGVAYRLFVLGEPPPAAPGRVDDFTWQEAPVADAAIARRGVIGGVEVP